MAEWVVMTLPSAWIGYGAALFLCLFDRFYRATRGWFTVLSAVVALCTTGWLLLNGASLWEGAALLTVFLLLNMGGAKE